MEELGRRKQVHDTDVIRTKNEFEEQKQRWKEISEKKKNNLLLTEEEENFITEWENIKDNFLEKKFTHDKELFFLYQEWCKINGFQCNWSFAKTVDESRMLLENYTKKVGRTEADTALMVGLGNSGLGDESMDKLLTFLTSIGFFDKIWVWDGDSPSKEGLIENIADTTLGLAEKLNGEKYCRVASTALDSSMKFEKIHANYGKANFIELCPGKLNICGEVVYGGYKTHIFKSKYKKGGKETLVVWGSGLIGREEIEHATKLGYNIVVVSVKQMRNGKVVEMDVYEACGLTDYKMGEVSMRVGSSQ